MWNRRQLVCGVAIFSAATSVGASASELADAAMTGSRERVATLLQQGSDVDARQIDGTTALHWAVRRDDIDIIEMLLRAGADPTVSNQAEVTPIQLATINGSTPVITRLLAAGVRPNTALNRHGDTPLMMAARTGRIDAVQALLNNGADVNAKETWGGTTALMWAVAEHHTDAAKLRTQMLRTRALQLIDVPLDLGSGRAFAAWTTARKTLSSPRVSTFLR